MRVEIMVRVTGGLGDYSDNRVRREAVVEAEPEALQGLAWPIVCAGLAEAAVAEYFAKVAATPEEEA